MDRLIFKLVNNQLRFFIGYYIVVFGLIMWSYIEGVGDISGYLLFSDNGRFFMEKFKAGYFSSLNYGIYYIFFLPFFLRFFLATYATAAKLSNLPVSEDKNENSVVTRAIKNYTSTILEFLRAKISIILFLTLLFFFLYQSLIEEKYNYKHLSLGWVQGLQLKSKFHSINDTGIINRKFYFRNNNDLTSDMKIYDSIRVTRMSFAFHRIPGNKEFVIFLIFAKIFFSLFQTIVFFFNINIMTGIIKFFSEKNKNVLFKSKQFVETMEELVSNISIAGFFLTIFLFFRYVSNSQKGTFKPFDWGNIMASDQYIFLLGMMFIPFSAILMFAYVYISDKAVEIKKLSWRTLLSIYLPNIFFVSTFFIYLICFDPLMESQLKFMRGILQFVNKIFLG